MLRIQLVPPGFPTMSIVGTHRFRSGFAHT